MDIDPKEEVERFTELPKILQERADWREHIEHYMSALCGPYTVEDAELVFALLEPELRRGIWPDAYAIMRAIDGAKLAQYGDLEERFAYAEDVRD